MAGRGPVGIDTGSRRLSVAWPSERKIMWYETPAATTPSEEIRDLMFWLVRVAEVHWGDEVYLESNYQAGHGQIQNALRHSMTIGAVLATVGGTLIAPSTWKAAILGHGHADKTDTRIWLEASDPEVAATIAGISQKQRREDAADAWCIGLYGDLAGRHPDQLDSTGRLFKSRPVRRQ